MNFVRTMAAVGLIACAALAMGQYGDEGPKVGQAAPNFASTDQNGVKFKLSDYRGKVVVVDFWGTW